MRRRGSPPRKLAASDWKKIAIGGLLSVSGAVVAWFTAAVAPSLQEDKTRLDLLLIAAVVPVAMNVIRKWLSDTQE